MINDTLKYLTSIDSSYLILITSHNERLKEVKIMKNRKIKMFRDRTDACRDGIDLYAGLFFVEWAGVPSRKNIFKNQKASLIAEGLKNLELLFHIKHEDPWQIISNYYTIAQRN